MAAKQESNYNTQQVDIVKCRRAFLPICQGKSENKVKKCRPRSVSGIFPPGSAPLPRGAKIIPPRKNMSAAGNPLRRTVFLFSFRACHHRGFLSSLRSVEATTDSCASGFSACRSGLSMRAIVAYPTTRAPSCIGICFPTHRQCGYAAGERNVIVPRADAPGSTESTS